MNKKINIAFISLMLLLNGWLLFKFNNCNQTNEDLLTKLYIEITGRKKLLEILESDFASSYSSECNILNKEIIINKDDGLTLTQIMQ